VYFPYLAVPNSTRTVSSSLLPRKPRHVPAHVAKSDLIKPLLFTTGKNRIALAPLFTNRSGTSGDFIVTNLPNPGQA